MAVKSFVNIAQGVEQHLKSVYQPAPRPATRKSRSGTEILTDLYRRMDDLIAQIDVSDDSPSKKAVAYGQVARILQQLQSAERNAAVHIDNKALEDMTAQELEAVVQSAIRLKGGGGAIASKSGIAGKNNVDSPSHDGSRRVKATSAAINQKSESSTASETESQPAQKNKKQQQRAYASVEARRRKAAGTHLPALPKDRESTPDEETDANDIDAVLDEILGGF